MNEAELLFTELLSCDRAALYQNRDLCLGRDKSSLIASALKKRILGEPLAYVLGKTEFMGLEFKVGKGVFIPRPDTEVLVEAAIKIAHSRQAIVRDMLDLCTGCGCIAIALAKLLSGEITLTATDISEKALGQARQNALLNNVNVNFLLSDLFEEGKLRAKEYELIISNPPYIAASEICNLGPEIAFEPACALNGGADGLDFYRRIIKQAPNYLAENGFLIMEMGFNQRKSIEDIFRKSGDLKVTEVIKDYSNIDRVIVAKKGS